MFLPLRYRDTFVGTCFTCTNTAARLQVKGVYINPFFFFKLMFLCLLSGDRGDTCVQCEGSGPPGLPGPEGPKGERGE